MCAIYLASVLSLLAVDPAPRPFHAIDRELTAALRDEATAKDLSTRGEAVYRLATLFTELDRDPRLLESPALQAHRARARGRLVNVQKQLLRNLAKANGNAPAPPSVVAAASSAEERALASALAAEVSLAAHATGGPAPLFEAAHQGYRGGGPVGDHGEELVDLITRTIYPEKWEVNGGTSTIVYYRPLMCLVVTAPGTTHSGVENLLNGLRAAGN